MLNPDYAYKAIEYLYKDIENLTIGNPQPYTNNFDGNGKGSAAAFNNLMRDADTGELNKIFYGNITWCMYNDTAGAVNQKISIQRFNDIAGEDAVNSLYIYNRILSGPTTLTGITNPLFIQQIGMDTKCVLALNGFIFSLVVPIV